MTTADVIVLCLGATGSAATYHPARLGAPVAGTDQYTAAPCRPTSPARPHRRGGSARAIPAVPVAAIDGGRAGTQRGGAVPRSLRPGPPGWRRSGGRGVAF